MKIIEFLSDGYITDIRHKFTVDEIKTIIKTLPHMHNQLTQWYINYIINKKSCHNDSLTIVLERMNKIKKIYTGDSVETYGSFFYDRDKIRNHKQINSIIKNNRNNDLIILKITVNRRGWLNYYEIIKIFYRGRFIAKIDGQRSGWI